MQRKRETDRDIEAGKKRGRDIEAEKRETETKKERRGTEMNGKRTICLTDLFVKHAQPCGGLILVCGLMKRFCLLTYPQHH